MGVEAVAKKRAVVNMLAYMCEDTLNIWSNSVSNVKFVNEFQLYIFCAIRHTKNQVFGEDWLVWLAEIFKYYLHI